MLPDYPKLKADLSVRLVRFLRARHDFHLGPLSHVSRIKFFEGDTYSLKRSSGEVEPGEFKEAAALITIKDEEVPGMTLELLLQKLDDAAQDMARQQGESVYRSISEATEKAGNVVDAGGQRLTAQSILDALSKIQIDFNRDGTPSMPEIHIHPRLSEAVLRAGEELEKNSDLKRQLKQILAEKREEWRAREATRRLAG
jgi:hypothetical protein